MAVELLALPCAPLPRFVRRRLLESLQGEPGIGGPQWNETVDKLCAMVEGFDKVAGRKQTTAAELREQIARWVGDEAWDPDEGIPQAQALALCEQVESWARGRAFTSDDPDIDLVHAAKVARTLADMLRVADPSLTLPRMALLHTHEIAMGEGATAALPAEAGCPGICRSPGAVLSGVDDVVWWGFIGELAGGPSTTTWSADEQAGLAKAAVELPVLGELRQQEALNWKQAIAAAGKRLVLVRWRQHGGGLATPHPFWDELTTRMGEANLEACTLTAHNALTGDKTSSGWAATITTVAANPTVEPQSTWSIPAEHLKPTRRLSATSIEALLGCPLKWVLNYAADLQAGAVAELTEDNRMVGTFLHAILQDTLHGPTAEPWDSLTPDSAAQAAAAAFDARVATEAAPLLRPERLVERLSTRRTAASAMHNLVTLLKAGGWSPREPELPVTGTFAGLPFRGFIDLPVEKADGTKGVLDLKLGGSKYRLESLRKGESLQLALYARGLADAAASLPPTAYFILEDARLLTTSDTAFPGATVVNGNSEGETLLDAERAWKWWQEILATGLVLPRGQKLVDVAQATESVAASPPPDEGPGGIKAPCHFCDFKLFCTFSVGGEG